MEETRRAKIGKSAYGNCVLFAKFKNSCFGRVKANMISINELTNGVFFNSQIWHTLKVDFLRGKTFPEK